MTRQTQQWIDATKRDVAEEQAHTYAQTSRRERLAFCAEYLKRHSEALSELELSQLEAALWNERQRRAPATGEVLTAHRDRRLTIGFWSILALMMIAALAAGLWGGR